MTTAKVTSKGQITIPKSVRDRLGLRPGEEIAFQEHDGVMQIRKVLRESPFDAWAGFLRNADVDSTVEELRGR
jgi:antitoxin PrlF